MPDMDKSSLASAPRKVFYQEARALAIIVALIILPVTAVLWSARRFNAGMFVLLLIALVYVIRILLPAVYNRVVITAKGLDFRQIGYHIRTTWDNVERMTYVRFDLAEGDILVLREPAVEVNRWVVLLNKDARWLEQNKKFTPPGKIIPLFLLNTRWRTDKLGQEVRSHAPHLFVEYEK
jgi:hypothetical protein